MADYFDMLRYELLQDRHSKTGHRRELKSRLGRGWTARSSSSTRTSARFSLEWACRTSTGKPGNYQHSLVDGVEDYLGRHPDYFK